MTACYLRDVDRVVEVGVTDEHADDMARRSQVELVERWVRQRGHAADDTGQRDTREVRIDVERLTPHSSGGNPRRRAIRARAPRQLERLVRELAHGVGCRGVLAPRDWL